MGNAMPDLPWKEAIVKVLTDNPEPMHYSEIAEEIVSRGLRTDAIGATPAATVNAQFTLSFSKDGDASPFVRVSPGYYTLKLHQLPQEVEERNRPDSGTSVLDSAALINAFGMFWQRDKVQWRTTPRLLGHQQVGSTPVDFCAQHGVYLLYHGHEPVYVGRTTEQPLGVRLKQHTVDRLNGRWDRFSWFGIYSVNPDGSLSREEPRQFTVDNLIATMEALLIEGLEPPQNRRRGDDFRAVEFLQLEDPEIEKARLAAVIDRLKYNL